MIDRGLHANPKKNAGGQICRIFKFNQLAHPGMDQHQSDPGIKRSEIKILNDCNQIHSRNKIFTTETR